MANESPVIPLNGVSRARIPPLSPFFAFRFHSEPSCYSFHTQYQADTISCIMQEQEKPQKVVKVNTVMASGIAAAMAALFTSGLGVAGTLIGAALTAMTINLGSAILSAQLEKASTKISGLPETVRGRLSTQQVRAPGKHSPEHNPEPAAPPAAKENLFGRLRSTPGYLRGATPSGRRRVLLAGALAGLVATFIGLATVTGVEATAGETLSCLVWGECQEEEDTSSGSTGGARTSIGRFFGGSYAPGTEEAPSGEQQQDLPGDGQPTPQQPAGESAQPGAGGGAGRPYGPRPSGEVPNQEASPQAQPGTRPGSGTEAEPGANGEVKPTPPAPPSSQTSEKGQSSGLEDKGPEDGQQKEDRDTPGPL